MKARDVKPGDTILCCRGMPGHTPRPVTVRRVIRPARSRHVAFGYHDTTSAAAKDTNGITAGYLPDDEVAWPSS